jgi:acyl-CoA reductase-like NAD-dependent aldehyde dehydrogenase
MSIPARQIAEKLWVYADLLESEKCRLAAMQKLLTRDADEEAVRAIEREIESVREMARALWEQKGTL